VTEIKDIFKNMGKNFNSFLKKRMHLRKIFFNFNWLMIEDVFRMALGLIVGVLVARCLGPKNYGILSYAFSIIAFLGTFTYLGLSGLVIREVVNHPDEKDKILGTTFFLKFLGGAFAFLIVFLTAFFAHSSSKTEFWVLIIIGLSSFARPFQTIEYWFYSKTQAKYKVIANSIALASAASLKIFLVLAEASIIFFAFAASLEFFLIGIFLVAVYQYKGFSFSKWTVDWKKAKELLSQSWIIILAGFLALINLKVDQIMLRWMIGPEEVGIYAVAAKFSEVWYIFPTAIVISIFPRLLELKETDHVKYDQRLQQAFDILFIISFSLAVLTTFFADSIISFLFGGAYFGSAPILVIHIWAGIFMFMRVLFSKWIFIENVLMFSLISHGFGALVNVILNIYFIPNWGGRGAAITTLISYAASSYFFLFFHSKTRPLALIMSKSFILPIRLVMKCRMQS
jgi:O-antigen/teichoic acid export membrane protein